MNANLHHLRQNYKRSGLLETEVSQDPIRQFDRWFQEATNFPVTEANAMSLATVNENGAPRIRTVLLKDYGNNGFTYYTNLKSIKSINTNDNPNVSVLFPWIQMERQIRIDGQVHMLDRTIVDAYFHERPRESQLGAWASEQSQPIASREALEARMHALEKKYEGKTIPTPPFWGGYYLIPECFEFWQGRGGRLHDRLEYRLVKTGEWQIRRLQP